MISLNAYLISCFGLLFGLFFCGLRGSDWFCLAGGLRGVYSLSCFVLLFGMDFAGGLLAFTVQLFGLIVNCGV